MIRSLRTGVSGLKSNQVRMDVIGNNVSNVNTTAFKRSRATFNEVLGQQLLGVGRTAGGTGINPSYVGLGVSVGSIDQNWTQGALENTGVATDLALNGDGFFVARNGDENLLTRAGNFTFNQRGELVTANGLNVRGWAYDQSTGELVTGALSDINIDMNAQAPAKYTQNSIVGGNLSAEAETGTVQPISSTIYDEQGRAHNVVIEFTKTANANEWSYNVSYAGDAAPPPFSAIAGGTLTFNVDGTFDAASANVMTWDPGYVSAAAPNDVITLDFNGLTQYKGSTTATFHSQDGYTAGVLQSYAITPEGILQVSYTNGQTENKFRLAIGHVNNPNGLEQHGESFYRQSVSSGDLQLGQAGRDLRTAVVAGTLEMSNVDLASEFTEMIVAQRGYQASARVITTSDELLQETVQLKR